MILSVEEQLEDRAAGAPGKRGGEPHRQPELDGVRGLAILLVLISHAAVLLPIFLSDSRYKILVRFMVPGWGGVDLFFALSGFLITGILLRGKHGPGYFKSFYARRVLRIFPIYYLFLIASLLICTQVPYVQAHMRNSVAHLPGNNAQKLSYFLYLQNWPVFWPSLAVGLQGLWGAYWSLAVEEQFYLVWPTLVRFVRASRLFWFCVCAVASAPLIRAILTHYTGDTVGLLQFPVSRLDGLFAGAALAFYREKRGRPLPLPWVILWLSIGVGILTFVGLRSANEFTSPGYFINRIGITALALISIGLIGLTQLDVPLARKVFSCAPLTFLGQYSYGIYIYHLTVFFLLRRFCPAIVASNHQTVFGLAFDCLAILLSLGLALISYTFIESPNLALKRYFPSPAQKRRTLTAS